MMGAGPAPLRHEKNWYILKNSNVPILSQVRAEEYISVLALVGFQGRGFDNGVQPDFWTLFLLKVLIFSIALGNELGFLDNSYE